MVSKANQSSDVNTPPRIHGSSLYSQQTPLDSERAASMADEGGVAGAITDAREQAAERISRSELAARPRLARSRWLPWALAAVGVFFLVRFFRS